ncbi:MAG: hypothetical protein V4490_07955 [Pseudomonadota bacterium]
MDLISGVIMAFMQGYAATTKNLTIKRMLLIYFTLLALGICLAYFFTFKIPLPYYFYTASVFAVIAFVNTIVIKKKK